MDQEMNEAGVELSAVVPAYNEGENITLFLESLKGTLDSIGCTYEVIVIDDGSTDETGRKAQNCGVEVISHEENLGYGRSLKDGMRAAKGEYILLIDSDGTYDVGKIPEMFRLMKDADLVIGRRVFSKKSTHHFKNVTRRFFAYLVSYYAGWRVEDLNSGQRIFRRSDVADSLDRYPDGFSFTSTMVVLYLIDKKRIVYTPVDYKHRPKGSKFLSRTQISALGGLAIRLTFLGRPLKASLQLGSIVILSTLLCGMACRGAGACLLSYAACFACIFGALFFAFLCYIYAMGRSIKERSR
jgi:glycosyltransferase involved in cell wall biosynthesis